MTLPAFAAGAWLAVTRCRTVASAVRAATALLEQSEVPEPSASAEHLAVACFERVTSRSAARTTASHAPNALELERFATLCRERQTKRTPVQYLVGDWDFHNVTLLVRAPVLIPRPETEELVEHVLGDFGSAVTARVLDVGCGSGAIVLAVLAARRAWTGVGLDISKHAAELSRDNAQLLGLTERCDVMHGDIAGDAVDGMRPFDVLVSNPPYIPTADMAGLDAEVAVHEDHGALCGGGDGLDVVRSILRAAPRLVKQGGSVWLEVDTSHPSKLATEEFEGLQYVATHLDLYGHERFCHLRVTRSMENTATNT